MEYIFELEQVSRTRLPTPPSLLLLLTVSFDKKELIKKSLEFELPAIDLIVQSKRAIADFFFFNLRQILNFDNFLLDKTAMNCFKTIVQNCIHILN